MLTLAVAETPGASLVKVPLPPEDRAKLRAILQWPQECEDDHQAVATLLELPDARVRFLEIAPGKQLVEVGCARGAYQEAQRYFLLDESTTAPQGQALKLPAYELDEDDQWQPQDWDEVAGDASFDPKRKTLTIFARARGIGDCGQRATWRYDTKSAKLVLVEFRGRACDDEPDKAGPPEKWPRVFPSPSAPAKPR